MAYEDEIREQKNSQEENDTIDGIEVVRVFHMTWVAWSQGYGTYILPNGATLSDFLPQIGWYWGDEGDSTEARDHLRVISRNTKTIDNVWCKVVITYSTKGQSRKSRPDEVSSWTEELDSTLEQKSITGWNNAGTLVEWKTIWDDSGPSGSTEENAPSLTDWSAKLTYRLTCEGKIQYTSRFMDTLRKINSTEFLSTIDSTRKSADSKFESDYSGSDVGKWMFTNCRRSSVKPNLYRYDLSFIYDPDGWGYDYGIYTNRYEGADLAALVNGMKQITEDEWGGSDKTA